MRVIINILRQIGWNEKYEIPKIRRNRGMNVLKFQLPPNLSLRIITSIVCLLLTGTLLAQDINKAEYFFDTDPGVGNAIDIPVSPAGTINLTEVFDASGLSAGYHTVSVRVRMDNGMWSHMQARRFYHEPVVSTPTTYKVIAAEYFFDNNDPGKGMASTIPINPAAETINIMDSIAIAAQGLSVGNHTISIRFKSDLGLWGATETQPFEICASDAPVANFEYSLVGDKLTITDKSQNASTYAYDFGDGNASTIGSPVHTYTATGTFTVCQTVTNTCGSDMFCEQIQQSNVAPVISAPIADVTRAEDSGTYNVISNLNTVFTDDNFDQLTFTATSSNPSNVMVNVIGNSLSITPASNFHGTATITVKADDGALNVSDQFTVTITPVNDAPTVLNAIPNQVEDEDSGPWTVVNLNNGVFVDADGNNLTFTASSDNNNISTSLSNNQLILSSTTDYFGTANITVTASDGSLSVNDVFTMTITSVNDAPTAGMNGLPNKEIQEGAGLTTLFSNLNDFISDPEGDNFSYSIDAGQYTSNFTLTGNQLEVEMPANYTGSFTVRVIADDGQTSANIPFLLTVTEVNDAPVLDNPISDKFYNENSGSHVVVSDLNTVFSDPENTTLSFSAVSSNNNITVSVNGNSLTVNSTANYTGAADITITASDGLLMKQDEFKVTYIPTPSPTDITFGEYWFDTDPGQGNGIPFQFPNPNDNVSTTDIFDASGLSEGYHMVGVRVRTGEGVWSHQQSRRFYVEGTIVPPIPNKIIAAEYFFDTDPGQGNATTINIGGATELVNLTNTIDITSAGLTEGQHALNIRFQSDNGLWSNVESRTFNYCNATIPTSNFDYTLIGNTLTLTNQSSNAVNNIWLFGDGNGSQDLNPIHNYTQIGSYEVCLININGCVRDTLCQMVEQTNVAPALTSNIPDITINEDAGLQTLVENISTYFTDANGDNLTYTISENNGNISTNLNGNQIQATPDANYFGSTSITACANDGQLDFCTNFNLTVAPVNDAPTSSTIPTVTIQEDGGAQLVIGNIDTYFSDIDGDALVYSVTSNNTDVVSSLQTNTMNFATPSLNYNGTAIYTVTASDGTASATATFEVIVMPVNDAPTILVNIPDATIFNEGGVQTVINSLSSHFTDVDGDNLTYILNNDNSAVMVNIVGNTIEASAPGFEGTTLVTVTATDGILTVVDEFVITVNSNPNNAPIVISPIADISLEEDAGEQIVADLSMVFSDPDNDDMTFERVSSNPEISVMLEGNQVVVESNPDYFGTAIITLTASDDGLSITDEFIVTILPVNDAPTITTLENQVMQEGEALTDLVFTIDDIDDVVASLSFRATSSNTNILPNENLVVTDNGNLQVLTINPVSVSSSSTVTITLEVTDGDLTETTSFDLTIDNLTAIQIVDLSSTALLSPNPAEDFLLLSLENDLKGALDIQIMDALGRLLLLEKVEKNTESWSHRLELNRFNAGMYYLRILKEDRLIVTQFIKI